MTSRNCFIEEVIGSNKHNRFSSIQMQELHMEEVHYIGSMVLSVA
jgi:hypothetical protein